jgi:hypothetical protein
LLTNRKSLPDQPDPVLTKNKLDKEQTAIIVKVDTEARQIEKKDKKEKRRASKVSANLDENSFNANVLPEIDTTTNSDTNDLNDQELKLPPLPNEDNLSMEIIEQLPQINDTNDNSITDISTFILKSLPPASQPPPPPPPTL